MGDERKTLFVFRILFYWLKPFTLNTLACIEDISSIVKIGGIIVSIPFLHVEFIDPLYPSNSTFPAFFTFDRTIASFFHFFTMMYRLSSF